MDVLDNDVGVGLVLVGLEDMVLGKAPPVVLCQQTSDLGVAEEWFATLSVGGIEGIVVKDTAAPYPMDRGQRVWWKVKARHVPDLLAVGVLGDPGAPTALVLACTGGASAGGRSSYSLAAHCGS